MAFHPPDILSLIAEALFFVERSDHIPALILEEWLTRATTELVEMPPPTVPPWEMSESELTFSLESFDFDGRHEPASTYEQLLSQIRSLQLLDSWHYPLVGAGHISGAKKTLLHQASADILAFKGYYGSSPHGRVIPAGRAYDTLIYERNNRLMAIEHLSEPVVTGENLQLRPRVLHGLLDYTVFLPWKLDSADPDYPELPSSRQVAIEYKIPTLQTVKPGNVSDRPLKISIAPLAQARSDAIFNVSSDGKRYNVIPNIPYERIENIISLTISTGHEYLFFPELTVDEKFTSEMGAAVRRAVKMYVEANGTTPAFRGLFAGIAGKGSGTKSTNYVVALDMFGVEIWRQQKLFRWNLNESQIVRFEILKEFPSATPPLIEDIDEGESLTIFDSPDLGRVLLFICADISSNSPGDWILSSSGINFVYAPIMDQSIAWNFDTRGIRGPWITNRAHRAAFSSTSKVLVTNSMSLTHRLNNNNKLNGDNRIFEDCGVAFIIDSTIENPSYCLVTAPVESTEDLVININWGEEWTALLEQ